MFFKGKILVRRATGKDGKPILVIAGWVLPDADIEKIDDRDEMWAVNMAVLESKKFVNANNLQFSPEDFLENVNDVQDPKKWKAKDEK